MESIPSDHQQSPPPPPSSTPVVPTPRTTSSGSSDEIRTIWIFDLEDWMDENYLRSCFGSKEEIISVRVIRNEQTEGSTGYASADFATQEAAERTFKQFNGKPMPHSDQLFRIVWDGRRRSDENNYAIFVGDLAPFDTYPILQKAFRIRYPSVIDAKVIMDQTTGKSKLFGFVRFGDPNEQKRAVKEMNGVFLTSRPMRVGLATQKATDVGITGSDPDNTTLYAGGLKPGVTEENLRRVFSEYGELTYVKIHQEKRYGLIQFFTRSSAEKALNDRQRIQVGGKSIKLSWYRSPSNKQPPNVRNPCNSGASSSGGGLYSYSGSGYFQYAGPYQHPNVHAGGSYQNHNMYAAWPNAIYRFHGGYPQQ